MTNRAFYRLIVEDGEKTLFEGRVEDRSIFGGSVQITAYGAKIIIVDGTYDEETINHLVQKRLMEMAEHMKEYPD